MEEIVGLHFWPELYLKNLAKYTQWRTNNHTRSTHETLHVNIFIKSIHKLTYFSLTYKGIKFHQLGFGSDPSVVTRRNMYSMKGGVAGKGHIFQELK